INFRNELDCFSNYFFEKVGKVMGIHSIEKKHLSAKGMLTKVRSVFKKASESSRGLGGLKPKIPLEDCLMSALAIFGLKFPSLLQFDQLILQPFFDLDFIFIKNAHTNDQKECF